VRSIKRGRPDARVTVAAPAKIAAMWKLVAEVDEIISLPDTSIFANVRSILREQPFDVAILFPNSLRVALEAWLEGIPRRVGYRGHFRSWLLNQVVRKRTKPGRIEHQAEHYLGIARDLGAGVVEKGFDVCSLPQNPDLDNRKIALCPGAEYGPAKRWLPERFAAAACAIAEERPVEWILFGTTKDAALGETISAALGDRCVNRIGQTTLDQLIGELRACRLLLTNDTGTMHLASLLGLPTVAIFGSTEPQLTGPLGNTHVVLRHHVECSPCFLRECPIDFRCMKAINVEEVVAAVRELLERGKSLRGAANSLEKSGR
jgi:lipopolysaccharide heptosyltransferase II